MGVVSTTLSFREDLSRKLQNPVRALQNVIRQAETATRRLRDMARVNASPVIRIRDQATRVMNRIRNEVERLGRMRAAARIIIEGAAEMTLNRIRDRLQALNNFRARVTTELRDRATSGLRSIQRMLQALNRLRARPIVLIRDLATSSLRSVRAMLLWIGRRTVAATVHLRNLARGGLIWTLRQLQLIGGRVHTATIYLRNQARSGIVWTWIQLQNINSRVNTATIYLRNQARSGIVWTWRQLQLIGTRIQTATIYLRNQARSGIIWTWRQLQLIGSKAMTAVVNLRNRARTGLIWTWRELQRLGGRIWTVTVNLKDSATAGLKMIQRAADKASAGLMALAGTFGLSLGGILAQGTAASHSDALIASQSNLYVGNVTSGVDDIFYNRKGGTDRESVAQIYGRTAQQTGLRGEALHRDAAIASQYQAITPEGDPKEIVRAFSAMKNSQGASFKRTGDALAYVRRNGGDQYDDLLDTFNEYATSAAKANISPEQLANGLVKYQKSGGRNYDNPADSLREWGIRSITSIDKKAVDALRDVVGDKETKKMYADLKKAFKDGDGAQGSFDFLSKTVEGLNKIDNPMRKHLAQVALYGTQFEDNDVAVQDFFDGLLQGAQTTGELERAFKQLKDSDPANEMMTSWNKFKKITKDLGVSIITELQPTFKELNDWASSPEGKVAIDNFTTSVKDLAVALGGALADAIQWTIKNWDKVEPVIIGVGAALISSKTAIPGLIVLFKWIKKTFDFLGSPAGKSVGKFIGKVTLLVTAITGLIETFEYLSDTFSFFSTLTDGFSGEGIIATMGAIATAVGGVAEKFSLLNTLRDIEAGDYSVKPPKPIVSNEKLQDPATKAYHKFGDSVINQNKKLQKKLPKAEKGLRRVNAKAMEVEVHQDEIVLPKLESNLLRDMAEEHAATPGRSGKASGGSGSVISPQINLNGDIHINNGTDEQTLLRRIAATVRNEMQGSSEGGLAFES